mgnify:CR=1 FL=1
MQHHSMEPMDFVRSVGGPVKVAKALGLRSHTSVLKWRSIPAKHVVSLEECFGIAREILRPDIFRSVVSPRSAPTQQKGEAA